MLWWFQVSSEGIQPYIYINNHLFLIVGWKRVVRWAWMCVHVMSKMSGKGEGREGHLCRTQDGGEEADRSKAAAWIFSAAWLGMGNNVKNTHSMALAFRAS